MEKLIGWGALLPSWKAFQIAHLSDELGSKVLKLVSEFNVFCYGYSVLSYFWRSIALLQNHTASFRAKGHLRVRTTQVQGINTLTNYKLLFANKCQMPMATPPRAPPYNIDPYQYTPHFSSNLNLPLYYYLYLHKLSLT